MKYVRFAALGAAALTLTAALGACGQQPGQAFQFNDTVYSVADLDQAAEDYAAVIGTTIDNQALANSLFAAQIIIQTAQDDYQLEISDEDAKAVLDEVQQQNGVTDPVENPGRGILDVAKATSLSTQMSMIADTETLNQQLTETLETADKELNPRYGLKVTGATVEAVNGFGDVVLPGATAEETTE